MGDKLIFSENKSGGNTLSDNHDNRVAGLGISCANGEYVSISQKDGDEAESFIKALKRLAPEGATEIDLGDLQSPLNVACESEAKEPQR